MKLFEPGATFEPPAYAAVMRTHVVVVVALALVSFGARAQEPGALNDFCEVDGTTLNAPGTCDFGLVCVPIASDEPTGICRVRCGDVEVTDDRVTGIVRNEDIECPESTTCQATTPPPAAQITSMACVEVAAARDEACSSIADLPEDSCPAGLDCRVSAAFPAGGQLVAFALKCKEPCEPAAPVCANPGDECLPSADREALLAGIDDAPPFFSCGTRVPTLFAADADRYGDPDVTCNEIDASRYCDPAIFDGASNPGRSVCLGIAGQPDFNGICFALCRDPGADANLDGDFDDDGEKPVSFDCAPGFECRTDLAAALGFGSLVHDATGFPRACPEGCENQGPCAACGDEGYCLNGSCMLPAGSCEPTTTEGEGEGEGEPDGTCAAAAPAPLAGMALVLALARRRRVGALRDDRDSDSPHRPRGR